MPLAQGADIVFFDMFPVLRRISNPVVTLAIITAQTYDTTTLLTEMTQEAIPSLAIEAAVGAFMVK